MTDVTYTDFIEDIDSSAVDAAFYNTHTKEFVVVLNNDETYVYTGVPSYVWTRFKDASSKGTFWSTTIKRDYGPSRHLGDWYHLKVEEYSVPAPSMASVTPIGAGRRTFPLGTASVGTPKGLTLAPTATVTDATSSSAEVFPAKTNEHEQVLLNHTVVFDIVGGRDGNSTDVEATGVQTAREEIERVAAIMGLEVNVRAVTVYFE